MREILQKMLEKPEPVRRFGRVESSLPDGRYIVVDDQERKTTVDGAAGYLPGASVIVQTGRIVGVGSRPAIKKTYRV